MTANFLTVKNLFSAYLNQDFDLMFGTADDAVRAFLEQGAQDELMRAKNEIKAILAMKLPENELQKLIFGDMGCCYCYPDEWLSAELWLNHVLHVLDG